MSCSGSKSLTVKVCGGKGPYTVSVTGSVSIKRQNGDAVGASDEVLAGQNLVLTPPTNSGSAVAGTAYIDQLWRCTACLSGACSTRNTGQHFDVGCDDVVDGCFQPADGHAHCSPTDPGVTGVTCCIGGGGCLCLPEGTQTCPGSMGNCVHTTCDDRSAGMIAAGCNPCGVSAAGKVVTATDSLGNSVAQTLGS